VEGIEEKLQFFINMYEEDRKKLNAMAYAVPHPPPSTPCPDTPLSGVSPPHVNPNMPFVNPMSPQLMYSSISQGLQKLTQQQPNKPRSILTDPATNHSQYQQGSVSSPVTKDEIPLKGTIKNGKKPFKKRVTLGYIPSRLDRVDSDEGTRNDDTVSMGSGHWSTSIGMSMAAAAGSTIVPPSVRIQGCTPPSEHDSLDGEICKYFKDDFSESSEVSTYLEGVSSPETSHTNLTDLSRVPEVIVTQEFATPNFSSPHRKLAATFSAPPTFPTTYLASGLVNQNNHASDSSDSGSTGSKKTDCSIPELLI